MRRTALLLTVATVLTLNQVSAVQSKSFVQRSFASHNTDRSYAQVAAAGLWGNNFAEVEDQIASQVVFGLNKELKKKLADALRDKLAVAAKKQVSALSASQVDDAEIARYILTEIGNEKKPWMKALGKVAKMGIKMSPVGPLVASEMEAYTAAEADGIWDKIKSIFSRKKEAKTAAQVAAFDQELDAQVEQYILAEGQGIFDKLKKKAMQAAKEKVM